MKKLFLFIVLLSFIISSCNVGSRQDARVEQDTVMKFTITEEWRTDTVFLTPESVIYDEKRDILYVSNVNMEPRMKDNNGFISKMDKSGNISELRWIEGLSSPKGLAIAGDTLYAADVDELVVMDILRGTIIKKVPIEGSRMINDITADDKGNLYISDTDANKIYRYSGSAVTEWVSEGLNGPNGLLFNGEDILVASQGSNDFASIDLTTREHVVLTDSITHGDGIAFTGIPGYYIVTDWEGEIFMVNHDNTRTSLLKTKDQQTNTADIEYIKDLNMLYVPAFFRNCVIGYRLTQKETN